MTNTTKKRKTDLLAILKLWIAPILSIVAICAFPPMFLYFQNADEASFSEILIPMLSFILVGMIHFIVFLFITKSATKSSVISSLFMLFYLNYVLIERVVQKVFPNLRYWHIVLIGIFALANLAWLISKKIKKEHLNIISTITSIVFISLIMLNAIFAIPTYVKKLSIKDKPTEEITDVRTNTNKADLPNIYYIVLDEYSSVDFMKKYYGYDNSKFTDDLVKMGFNVSHTSHNESIMTTTVMTNIVNLDYIVDNTMLNSEKAVYRKNNVLFKLLSSKGYDIIGVGGGAEAYGLENAASDSSKTQASSSTVKGETISDLLYNQTIAWPFYTVSYSQGAMEIMNAFEYLKDSSNFPNSGCFIICHVDCPHEPFYFKRNGDTYNSVPKANWEDKNYYLEQYIYATNQVTDIVESILMNDPYSCIIIQSDHSARASSNSELFMEIFTLEDMSNFFNAVYIGGEELDINGLSGVNTLRLFLNRLLGEEFEMLDVPVDTYKYK